MGLRNVFSFMGHRFSVVAIQLSLLVESNQQQYIKMRMAACE